MKTPFYSKDQIESYAEELILRAISNGVGDGPCLELYDVVDFVLHPYQICLDQDLAAQIEAYTCFSTHRIMVSSHAELNPVRKRFTLAHEIGHIVLHSAYMYSLMPEGQVPLFEIPSSVILQDSYLEYQANYFASALLIPRNQLMNLYHKTGDEILDAALVANHFGVSRRSAEIRLEQLKLLMKIPPSPRLF